jgi:hypothetical protein
MFKELGYNKKFIFSIWQTTTFHYLAKALRSLLQCKSSHPVFQHLPTVFFAIQTIKHNIFGYFGQKRGN